MDSLRSCFTTEMYLWGRDRPPVPVRWFFAEPDAEVFPYVHSFWNVDWEMDKGYKGDNDLIGERGAYANGSTFVHYPGTHFHGPAQAFIDGGRWGIDPPLTTGPDGAIAECRVPPGSPAGWIDGGIVQTQLPESHACQPVGYGMLLKQHQRPESHMCTGYWLHGSVRQVEAPSALFTSGTAFALSLLQAQHTASAMVAGFPFVGAVVQAQAPSAGPPPDYALTGSVVQAENPASDTSEGFVFSASVLQAENPAADMESGGGGGSCGPVPTLIGSRLGTFQTGSTYEMGLPTGHADGDLILMVLWEATAPGSAGLPIGWTLLDSDVDGDLTTNTIIIYKTWHTGDSHGVDVSRAPGTQARGITLCVRGSGTPISGGFTNGTSGSEMTASVDGGSCPYLLFMAAGKPNTGNNYNTPSGMTDVQPDPTTDPVAVWYETPVGGGSSGARTVVPDSADQWAACLVACPPV